VQDNFFEMGGHSLLATQMMARIRDTFQIELPLRTLFEIPTIENVAQAIARSQGMDTATAAGSILEENFDSDSTEYVSEKLPAYKASKMPAGLNEGPLGVGTERGCMELPAAEKDKPGEERRVKRELDVASAEGGRRSLVSNSAVTRTSRLVTLQPTLAALQRPFFWIHPLGGTVSCYVEMSRYLGADQPVYGLQASEVTDVQTEQPYDSLAGMAGCYIEEIRAVQPAGPYALGGWSFGGLVAFEIAQQLSADGEQISVLAMLDTRNPQVRGDASSDGILLLSAAKEIAARSGKPLPLSYEEVININKEQQTAMVLRVMKEIGLVSRTVRLEDIQSYIHEYRNRERYALEYAVRPYPGRIMYFKAMDAENSELSQPLGEHSSDATFGWGDLSQLPIEVISIPCEHGHMCMPPHAETIGRILRARLGN
jgi:thioesterase domain-containing protein